MELFTSRGQLFTERRPPAALGFTGYQVDQTSGAVTFDAKYHDTKAQSVLASVRTSTPVR